MTMLRISMRRRFVKIGVISVMLAGGYGCAANDVPMAGPEGEPPTVASASDNQVVHRKTATAVAARDKNAPKQMRVTGQTVRTETADELVIDMNPVK